MSNNNFIKLFKSNLPKPKYTLVDLHYKCEILFYDSYLVLPHRNGILLINYCDLRSFKNNNLLYSVSYKGFVFKFSKEGLSKDNISFFDYLSNSYHNIKKDDTSELLFNTLLNMNDSRVSTTNISLSSNLVKQFYYSPQVYFCHYFFCFFSFFFLFFPIFIALIFFLNMLNLFIISLLFYCIYMLITVLFIHKKLIRDFSFKNFSYTFLMFDDQYFLVFKNEILSINNNKINYINYNNDLFLYGVKNLSSYSLGYHPYFPLILNYKLSNKKNNRI